MTTATASDIHIWEARGLGTAPFRLVAILSQPDKGLLITNPAAFNLAWSDLTESKAAFPGIDCLTICDVCGTCISNTYVVRDAAGKHLGVGCDCIEKSGDVGLVDRVKLAKREAAKARRGALRAAKWEAERPAREARVAEHERLEAERKQDDELKRKVWCKTNLWLLEVLDGERREPAGFIDGMIVRVERGPIADLSDRCLAILGEIYAKAKGGRRGSKAYAAAKAEFEEKVGG